MCYVRSFVSENSAASLLLLSCVHTRVLSSLWLGPSDDAHLSAQVMALHMVKSLAHVLSHLEVHTRASILVLSDQS